MKFFILMMACILYALMYTTLARTVDFSVDTRGIYVGKLNMSSFDMQLTMDPPKVDFKCASKADKSLCPPLTIEDAQVTIGSDYVHFNITGIPGTVGDVCSQLPSFQFRIESIVDADNQKKGFLVVNYNQQEVTVGERCVTFDSATGMVAVDWVSSNCATAKDVGCKAGANQVSTSFVVVGQLTGRQVNPEPSIPTEPSTPTPKPSSSQPVPQPTVHRSNVLPSTSTAVPPPTGQSNLPRESNNAPKSFFYPAIAVAVVAMTVILSHFNFFKF